MGQATIREASRLVTASDRRRYLDHHPAVATSEGIRRLDAAVFDLVGRDPRRALALADLAVAAGRRLPEADRLVALAARARTLFRLSRYVECEALHGRIARRRERRGEPLEAGLAHLARMGPLTNLGRLDDALEAAEAAGRLLRDCASPPAMARLEGNRGMLMHRLSRMEEALACFARARPHFARRRDRLNVAIIDLNRAQAHSEMGHARRAARLFASARRAFEGLDLPALVASTDYNIACDDFTNGRLDLAWTGLERARARFDALGDRDAVARADLDLAEMAGQLGAAVESRRLAARARRGFQSLGSELDAARARRVEAAALARSGAPAAARRALEHAITGFVAREDAVGAALARLDLAALLLGADPPRARDLARRAGRALGSRRLRNAAVRAVLVEGLALARQQAGRVTARRRLRRAADLARSGGVPGVAWRADVALAGLDLAAGRPVAARARLDRAVADTDALRVEMGGLEPAAWVLSDRATLYGRAIAAWLRGGTAGQAAERSFLHAERARSHDLAEALARMGGGPPGVLPSRWRADGGRGDRAATRRRSGASREPGAQSARRLAGRKPARRVATDDDPTGGRDEARLAAVRRALHTGEQLVEYCQVGDELWAFVVDRSVVTATRVARRASEVWARVEWLDFLLGRPVAGSAPLQRFSGTVARQTDLVLEELGRVLLAPIASRLSGRRLVVVPTRDLHHVPFAALRLDGRHVVERAATSLAPSALVLAMLRRRQPACGPALVVGVGDRQTPEVRREARAVAAVLPGSRLLLGREADRAAFRHAVRGRSLVHVATHGTFRPERPTLSALHLSDGPLTFEDVLDLPLSARLVTLAACDSGRSCVGPGDDAVGLASGFLHAGARSVLVSSFRLDDRGSRQLMGAFYRLLAVRADAALALRDAVLGSLGRMPEPRRWAAFTLIGAG